MTSSDPQKQSSPNQQLNLVQEINIDIRINPSAVGETSPSPMIQTHMPISQVMETNASFIEVHSPKLHLQTNENDYPPEDEKQEPYVAIPISPTQQNTNLVNAEQLKKYGSRTRTLRRTETKRNTYFFGILSKNHGFCTNAYRLLVALILLPITIIGLLVALGTRHVRRVLKWIRTCCCPTREESIMCCGGCCSCRERELDSCLAIKLCNCRQTVSSCERCYGNLSECCITGADSCTSCCTSIGTCFGNCIGWIGQGLCNCFNGIKDSFISCLDSGKELFAGCISNLGKCCFRSVEDIKKCYESADGCYSKYCQCQCEGNVCDALHKCCECKVNLSDCGDCTGDCCGDSVMGFLQCLQGTLCHLVEVLGGICEHFGFVCECLECIFR